MLHSILMLYDVLSSLQSFPLKVHQYTSSPPPTCIFYNTNPTTSLPLLPLPLPLPPHPPLTTTAPPPSSPPRLPGAISHGPHLRHYPSSSPTRTPSGSPPTPHLNSKVDNQYSTLLTPLVVLSIVNPTTLNKIIKKLDDIINNTGLVNGG